jgi:hypothetical protein
MKAASLLRRICFGLGVFLLGLAGCRGSKEEVESGAVLLRFQLGDGVPALDELRVFVSDEAGPIWDDVRVPAQGSLPPPQGRLLGTYLIQPGTTNGNLAIDVRGLAGGTLVAEGTMLIAPAERTRGMFDLVLGPVVVTDASPDAGSASDGLAADAGELDVATTDAARDAVEDVAQKQDAAKDAGLPPADAPVDVAGDRPLDALPDIVTPMDTSPLVDAAPEAPPACAFAGGCDLPLGATCGNNAQCRSVACVDGVCCDNACNGVCRACNLPGHVGTCYNRPAGTDPDGDCKVTGLSCGGNGACVWNGLKGLGDACVQAGECTSGSCKDGVCCNTACTGPCESCMGGTCRPVTKGFDAPECVAPMHCNATSRCVAD